MFDVGGGSSALDAQTLLGLSIVGLLADQRHARAPVARKEGIGHNFGMRAGYDDPR